MILIVGGSGFLGRHFRDLLRSIGEQSVIVARDVALAKVYAAPGERFVSSEDFDGSLGVALIAEASAIVYMRSISTPATYAEKPWLELSQVVVPVAEWIIKFAEVNPSAKRVFLSTGGAIYGNPGANPVDERQPLAPISAYGLGKQMVEEAVQFGGRFYGMSYNILRVANPIGRHHHNASQGVVPAAVRSLLARTEFKMFGDGSTVRDYVAADDVAEAILGACLDTQFRDRIWNIGSGVGRPLTEILDLVEAVAGRKLVVRKSPSRKFDVKKIILNCERVAADIGWSPKRDIALEIEDVWKCQSPHVTCDS